MMKALTIDQVRDLIKLADAYRGRFSFVASVDQRVPPTYAEDLENPQKRSVYQAIKQLSPAARRELTALMWVGRGVYRAAEWPTACRYAGANQTNGDLLYMLENGPLGEQLARGLDKLERGSYSEDVAPDLSPGQTSS